jgi:hypothetical protein
MLEKMHLYKDVVIDTVLYFCISYNEYNNKYGLLTYMTAGEVMVANVLSLKIISWTQIHEYRP